MGPTYVITLRTHQLVIVQELDDCSWWLANSNCACETVVRLLWFPRYFLTQYAPYLEGWYAVLQSGSNLIVCA